MNWLFRRHFWVINLAFVSLAAILLGKVGSTLLGYAVLKAVPEVVSIPVKMKPAKSKERNFDEVNDRNLFGAKREQLLEEVEEEEETGPGNWEDAGPSSLPLKLVSTFVSTDPFSSRVVVANTSSGRSKVYSINDCAPYRKLNKPEIETALPAKDFEIDLPCNNVEGMATVVRIENFRVYLYETQSRRYSYLPMGPEGQKMQPRTKAPTEGEGIRKTGPTSYQIDQAEFNRALGNVAKLMTEARATPVDNGAGGLAGFQITYLKEGSLFEKIGIEKMDILSRINGYELDSPEKALQLFSKLRFADQFTIDIKRGDRSVTLDYSVTP